MSSNELPSNPVLSEAMRRAAESGDPRDRPTILAELANGVLIVPIRDGEGDAPEVRAASSPEGEPLVFAFTDEEALRAWASGPVRWATITGAELAAFAAANSAAGLVLNPAGPDGGELSREEIARLAALTALEPTGVDREAGVTTMTVREGADFGVRPYEDPPAELVEGLRRALAGRAEVRSAYLLESVGPGGPHPVIGLLLETDAEPGALAGALGRAVSAELGRQATVDMIPIDDELSEQLVGRAPPLR